MANTKTIYHFILDKSGSMKGSEADTINGFNTQLEALRNLEREYPNQQYIVSLTFFNGELYMPLQNGRIGQVPNLDIKSYRPNGATALLDAIGKAIFDIKRNYKEEIDADKASVVMVIMTDGEENASRFYSYHDIARMINELDATGKWTFSFLGADLDAIHTAKMMNIRAENVIYFDKKDMRQTYGSIALSITDFAEEKAKGRIKKDIFDIFKEKDLRSKKDQK
jgi:uncharacterized protein YegL